MLSEDFLEKQLEDNKYDFKFPPSLKKTIQDKKLINAIFEDIKQQTEFVLAKYKADEALSHEWRLIEDRYIIFEFRISEIIDKLVLKTGIRKYIEEKKSKLNKILNKAPELSPEDRTKKYVNELFESFRMFNRDILNVKSKRQKKLFAIELFKEMLENTSAKKILNFKYMKSYNDFDFSVININLKELFKEEVISFVKTTKEIPNELAIQIVNSQKSDYFLLSLSKNYSESFLKELKNLIADTFFECTGMGKSATTIPPVIQEAISGTSNFKNILAIDRSNWVASKDLQVWNRVKIAVEERRKDLIEAKKTVDYYEKKANGIKKNIVAIRKASKIDHSFISKYSAQLLCDIALNEEKEYTEEKRLFQFVPKGSVALKLFEMVERGKRGARTPGQKDDFERAMRFYSRLNSDNDINSLKQKLQMYNEELPNYEEKLENSYEKYEILSTQGLEAYDDALKVMKRTIIDNLGRKKVYK